jgi:hypothetical protein
MGLLIRNGSTVGLSSPLAGLELWKKSSSSGLPCLDIVHVVIGDSSDGRQSLCFAMMALRTAREL